MVLGAQKKAGNGGRVAKLGSDGRRSRFRWTKTAGREWKEGATKLRNVVLGKNVEENSR